MEKILIVEDNPDIQRQMKWGLSKEFTVLPASDRKSAIALFEKNLPRVVTLDLGLPPDEDGTGEGFACLREIIEKSPHTNVIVITGNDDRENALKAVQMGAYDYFLKPVDMDEIKIIIRRAIHLAYLEEENRNLHTLLNNEIGFAGMIGQSPQMLKVFDTIRKVSTTDVTVLITGESGTGKELVANAIHKLSSRNSGPFVPINCAAIPETLLESELFGHEKGSFTGAYAMKRGKVEYAHKGTLFLDEVSELSHNLQAKLLRFLQEKKIQRIGGHQNIEVDTRILAATNLDMQEAIKTGGFREDLFYRLSVITINLPPLRERGQDIRLIANVSLERYKTAMRKKIIDFSPEALYAIENYSWHGNVRELEHRIQSAVVMTESGFIEPYALGLGEPPAVKMDNKASMTLKDARKAIEIKLIEKVLNKHRGRIKEASKELGVSRPTLYDLITKYGLDKKYIIK